MEVEAEVVEDFRTKEAHHKKTLRLLFTNNLAFCFTEGFDMWALRDSNPRPLGCKPSALNQLS